MTHSCRGTAARTQDAAASCDVFYGHRPVPRTDGRVWTLDGDGPLALGIKRWLREAYGGRDVVLWCTAVRCIYVASWWLLIDLALTDRSRRLREMF